MQRFYLIFSDILHVTHLHFSIIYWWAFRINERLNIISPFQKLTFIYVFYNSKIAIWNFG